MYKSFRLLLTFIITGLLLLTSESSAQNKLRVGIYDSRAIAVACMNSSMYKNPMYELTPKMKAAKEANDTKTISDIEREGLLRQAISHEQGFGTGSVMQYSELIKKGLAEIAKAEKLDVIVSKYELAFTGSQVVLVDITDKAVNFFNPTARVKSIVEEMKKTQPIKEAYLIKD